MEKNRYILLPQVEERWCVSAGTVPGRDTELHGGFKTYEEALREAEALRKEYSDYSYIEVVKITLTRP